MSSKTAGRRGPNPQQLQAIEATEGPVQIIAGPGSGKTYTLVERIVHIIQKHDLEPK
ncbi:MAG: UvrD-helicase domain-containing protein, partial [Bdellovibrio sp.]